MELKTRRELAHTKNDTIDRFMYWVKKKNTRKQKGENTRQKQSIGKEIIVDFIFYSMMIKLSNRLWTSAVTHTFFELFWWKS